jgi:hypothetical protein
MDIESLNKDILSALPTDPFASKLLTNTLSPRWTSDANGYLCCDGCIYVPEANDLHLCVLRYFHDYPLSGHFGQNHTLELIRREYTWPSIRTFIQDYVKSCTTCTRAKTPCHKPYGTLKQLPIPERPWDSISMDFIEQPPSSSGYTAILAISTTSQSRQYSPLPMTPSPPLNSPNSSCSMSSPSMAYPCMSHLIVVLNLSCTSSAHLAKHSICASTLLCMLDCMQWRASYRMRDGMTESARTKSASALRRG